MGGRRINAEQQRAGMRARNVQTVLDKNARPYQTVATAAQIALRRYGQAEVGRQQRALDFKPVQSGTHLFWPLVGAVISACRAHRDAIQV